MDPNPIDQSPLEEVGCYYKSPNEVTSSEGRKLPLRLYYVFSSSSPLFQVSQIFLYPLLSFGFFDTHHLPEHDVELQRKMPLR